MQPLRAPFSFGTSPYAAPREGPSTDSDEQPAGLDREISGPELRSAEDPREPAADLAQGQMAAPFENGAARQVDWAEAAAREPHPEPVDAPPVQASEEPNASAAFLARRGGRGEDRPMRMAPAMRQVSSSSQREGCRIIRHWSEVPLCGIGTSGCVSIGMGALGSGPILYVLGAVSLVALIPIWPIIRQYGTVRQQVALLEGVIQEQRQALEELSQRLEDLRAEAENLSAHESEISEHVEVLVEGVDRLEAAAESLAAAITSARQRRDELAAEVQSHRTAFEQLRQELGQRNQDLAALRETVANLQNRLHPIDGLLSQREAASQAFQERLQDLSLSLHDELTLLHEHERAVSRLNESEQLRLSIAELQQHVESCNRNLEQLTVLQQQRLDQTESAQQVAESSLADLTHRLSEIDHHLATLENASASEPARHNPVPPPE